MSRPESAPFAGQAPVTSASKRRWIWARRLVLALVLGVLLLACTVVGLFIKARFDLDSAIAEADQLDPGWRMDELEAKRAVLADADNAALHIHAVDKLFPATWPTWDGGPFPDRYALARSLAELTPNTLLTPPHTQALTEAREQAAKALAEARKLKDLPRGRYLVVRDREGLRVPGQAPANVADLLYYAALLAADEDQADEALDLCCASVNLARACGDEPSHFAQLRRLERRGGVIRLIERVLAQGEASDGCLAGQQKLVEEEEKEPVFLHGARGLRAWMDEMLEGMREERVQQAQLPLLTSAFAVNVRPATLRMTTRLVEIAKLPVEDQLDARDKDGVKRDAQPYLAQYYIVPKIEHTEYHLGRDYLRTRAELRCTAVALAAERYRRTHGHWPASAAVLVPDFLGAVPIDPYDQQPLRFRKQADGMVIYCIGPDRTDNDGKLDRGLQAPAGTDLGVQLWHPDKRRQPPPPPPEPNPR